MNDRIGYDSKDEILISVSTLTCAQSQNELKLDSMWKK